MSRHKRHDEPETVEPLEVTSGDFPIEPTGDTTDEMAVSGEVPDAEPPAEEPVEPLSTIPAEAEEPAPAPVEPLSEEDVLKVAFAKAALTKGHNVGWLKDGDRDVLMADLPSGQVGFHLPKRPDTMGDLRGYVGRYDGATLEQRARRVLDAVL